jgi:hypothetical protein
VVGVSWKAENTYPTGASGLSSTYLAEFELLITLLFLLCKFQVFESWISSLSLLFWPRPCLLILRLIIIRIAVFHDLSWFDIHICNYLSLSKDRKMSLWPSHFTIDIENKHSYNLNDKYLQDWLKSIEKHKLCCVKKAVKEIKNITGTLAFWPMTLKIRYTSCSLNG